MHKQVSIETPLGEVLIEAQSNGEISLAKGKLPHSISNGMRIDGSIACILTVKPKSETTDVLFSASLGNSDIKGSPATGECLDCLEFVSDDWHLTLGTEDQEMLNSRMPQLIFLEDPSPISYSPFQMALRLNGIAMKGVKSFHVIISYKKLPDERDCTAWFFADTPHEVANNSVNRTP